MSDIAEKLQRPFNPEDIDWRIQRSGVKNGKPWAIVLAYIQARAGQERLDEVFGWDGWTEEYRVTTDDIICRLGVKTDDGWIYKENGASETQVEAFKGGISSAYKRVLASGYGVGRYLYNLTAKFAIILPEGQKGLYKGSAKDSNGKKIWFEWNPPILPKWAMPGETAEQKKEYNEIKEKTAFKPKNKEKVNLHIITEEQVKELDRLFYETNSDKDSFMFKFSVRELKELTLAQYMILKKQLEKLPYALEESPFEGIK